MVIIKPEPRLAWNFVVADVKFPIIGADFLRYYGLLVDVRHNTPPHFSAFMEQYPNCVLLALFWSNHLNQSTWTYSMNFQPSPNQSRKKEAPLLPPAYVRGNAASLLDCLGQSISARQLIIPLRMG